MKGVKVIRWYILVGLCILAFVLCIANAAHADTIFDTSSGSQAIFLDSPRAGQLSVFGANSGYQADSLTMTQRIATPALSSWSFLIYTYCPYPARANVDIVMTIYSDAGYTTPVASSTFPASLQSGCTSGSPSYFTFTGGAVPAGTLYWQLSSSNPYNDTGYIPKVTSGSGLFQGASSEITTQSLWGTLTGTVAGGTPVGSPFYTWPVDYASGTIDWSVYSDNTNASTSQPLPFYLYNTSSTNASSSVDLASLLHMASGTGSMPWQVLPTITISSTTDASSTDLLLQEMGASATSTVSGFFGKLTGIAPFSWFFMLQQAYRGALPVNATSTFVLMPSSTLAFASSSPLVSGISGMEISFGETSIRRYLSSDKINLMRLMMASAFVIMWGWSLYHRSRLAFTPTHTV